jgi:hypothetical protein
MPWRADPLESFEGMPAKIEPEILHHFSTRVKKGVYEHVSAGMQPTLGPCRATAPRRALEHC